MTADSEEKTVSNTPFHLCHGRTLLYDEVFCERGGEDAVCGQRVAGVVMGSDSEARPSDILPTSAPRDWLVAVWPNQRHVQGPDRHAALT